MSDTEARFVVEGKLLLNTLMKPLATAQSQVLDSYNIKNMTLIALGTFLPLLLLSLVRDLSLSIREGNMTLGVALGISALGIAFQVLLVLFIIPWFFNFIFKTFGGIKIEYATTKRLILPAIILVELVKVFVGIALPESLVGSLHLYFVLNCWFYLLVGFILKFRLKVLPRTIVIVMAIPVFYSIMTSFEFLLMK